ncbi:hypothetical protein EMCRGX_G023806 [Ephydatia muelleri]
MQSIDHSNGFLRLTNNAPIPALKDDEVLIKAKGSYPPPPGASEILGVEVSGTVADLAQGVPADAELGKGDAVMVLMDGGGYAEFCAVPYKAVMRVPEGTSITEAAAIPEVFLTAYQTLFLNTHLKDGETLLVHAGASGVGLALIQLARTLFKGSDDKLVVCRENGADVTVNYKTTDFAEEVLSVTNKKGADVIVDFIGAPYWEQHMKCIAIDGRLQLTGMLGGGVIPGPTNIGTLLAKRTTVIGTTLRSRSPEYKHQLTKEFSACLPSLFTSGILHVNIDSVFSFDMAAQAHERMKNNLNVGKILLTWTSTTLC